MFKLFSRNNKTKRSENESNYNGFESNKEFKLVERAIRSTNSASDPIRSFSAEELSLATSDFSEEVHEDMDYIMYEGNYRDHDIYVKKFFQGSRDIYYVIKMIATEVEIASNMRNHPNVLKLLGYCLKTELPMLIYEFPEQGNLGTSLYNQGPKLSWDQKMKVVIGIANSVAYLQHGLSNTFIHRDINPQNILLVQNFSPKLFDFQLAICLPEGENDVEADLAGRVGFISPEACMTGRFTAKSDVYSFGVLLLEVLTEMRISDLRRNWVPMFENDDFENHDFDFENGVFVRESVEEYCEEYLKDERISVQVMECVDLVERCLKSKSEYRPGIIEAEMELRRIKNL